MGEDAAQDPRPCLQLPKTPPLPLAGALVEEIFTGAAVSFRRKLKGSRPVLLAMLAIYDSNARVWSVCLPLGVQSSIEKENCR